MDSHYSWKTRLWSTGSVRYVLGDQIRKTRIKTGLTQEQLAFRSKLSRNYISLLELDQKSPTVETLFRIAHALNFKVSIWISAVERQMDRGDSKRKQQ
jgi:transcriptional regulator with XRE-family HTH domain